MSAQAQALDPRDAFSESLKGPFVRSLLLHIVVLFGMTGAAWFTEPTERFGSPDAGGTAVGIESVESVPIPSRGRPNPVANDSKSVLPPDPAPPQPKPQEEKPPEDAVALNIKQPAPQPQPQAPKQRFKSFKELDNQLTSKTAPALSSQMFSQSAGSGQIGTGMNTTLGTRFGAYAQQIRELVSRAWRTNDVDPAIREGPVVIATFELMRDGTARNLRLLQRSGITTLDVSVQRAIQDASPFPPLPVGYEKDSATVEFQFELRR